MTLRTCSVAVRTTLLTLALLPVLLFAGNAHFVGIPNLSTSGATATVIGKVAGLGDVPQIHVVLSGDAACVNHGGKNPSAENKDTFSADGDFPVQNGKALFTLSVEATFQPSCAPPMSVDWSNLRVSVTAVDGTSIVYP